MYRMFFLCLCPSIVLPSQRLQMTAITTAEKKKNAEPEVVSFCAHQSLMYTGTRFVSLLAYEEHV